ncbi:MAG: S1C family serine protease [Patescibacteria group bacterium]|nr:S1C family serine protease [Patescibacteria group bacterium]
MPKITIENQNQEEKEFSQKEIVTPQKTEALEKLYENKEFATIQKPLKISTKIIILTMIVSVIFGLLAGFFGALYLLTRKEIKIPFFKKINFEEFLPKREITLFTEKNITVIPEERIADVTSQISPQVVRVFFSKKIDKSKEVISGFVLPEESSALAVILTRDGWLATAKDVLTQPNLSLEVLTSEKKRLTVKKIIFDDLSQTVFLKIEAKDLPVVKFIDKESLNFGKTLLFFDKFFNFDLALVSQPRFISETEKNLIQSTEKFSQFIKINKELPANFSNAPVFDLDGAFVGFVSQPRNKIAPLFHFQSLLPRVFKNEKIKRPFLGLTFIDLKDFSATPAYLENIKSGALVYSVKEKSPAFVAGFKKGDLIFKINNLPLEETKSLTEIIQEFSPGEEVDFLVIRENQEMTIKAKLGTL